MNFSEPVQIGNFEYVFDKMPLIGGHSQFHTARRLSPLLLTTGVLAGALSGAADDLWSSVAPVCNYLAMMPEQDVDYINVAALKTVYRLLDGKKARFMSGEGAAPMFNDVSLPELGQVIFHALKWNLSSFFTTSPGA
jgi:hypothetical protein